MDLRQTPEYAKYMESIGWIVERIDGINYFIRKFSIFGSFIKIQRPDKIEFNKVWNLAKKYRAFHIVIEPKYTEHCSLLTRHGFHQSQNYFVPSKTIHIDLTKSEKRLLKEMHYKTRYNIKKSHNPQLTILNSKDIVTFANFWQECALNQRGMFIPQKKEIRTIYKAFNQNADLLFALHSNKLVAGVLLIHADKISYYMYAASTSNGKKLFAPTLVAWEAIKFSKNKGSKIFDLEGIYDNRFPIKSWLGFARFKKSFGGKEVEYPGAFVKYRLPY